MPDAPIADLTRWTGVPRPSREAIEGRYVRLEPLDPARHGDDLHAASAAAGAEERFAWLPDPVPPSRAAFSPWLEEKAASPDPLYFAVVDRASGRTGGRQTLMRIDAANGVIEIGNILWGPDVARTRLATEALYLFADYVFGLGYRRFEWKCNDRNLPSKKAAARFGFAFEGVFRQHMVVKGENRDTAWFAMLDRDWPRLKAAYDAWLDPANFDADGRQKSPLRVA